jgi:PAS domain-containing protein
MGMLLRAPAGVLGGPEDPFLVVSGELRVVAVSTAAEQLFGSEERLLGSSVSSVVSSAAGEGELTRAIRRAALGSRGVVTLPEATIAPCGPPRAALVVMEPRLRAVQEPLHR